MQYQNQKNENKTFVINKIIRGKNIEISKPYFKKQM